ncbi:polysaccharide lyase family 4, domain III-domain-containing protein [Protomyces lactucae-debilis]|uniref:Polysaccharide lyase family 4, domain III-domain-containing protein n=1 Tax=Protomyces lactucae-debilis TaxID=2754530 RepID=A0A1Y2FBD6_PROLT|nr:polysaccharide lyase family 4, domain III-domain-containing protein [Protomyces lactucae-debilis]ORY80937.1 polysaccharide lyase family 4, domain III-domain-containing protein [Protomyces lactucae-debilis]
MQNLPKGCMRSRDWHSLLARADVQSLSQARRRHEHKHHNDEHVSNNRHSYGVQEYTVVLNNEHAQYWSHVDKGGKFRINGMLAGTYHVRLFQDQREVQATNLVLARGGSAQVSIEAPAEQATMWSIGCHDGRPQGFLNADKFERMHPSDRRMSSWLPRTVSVGDVRQFPMAQIGGLNPTTIRFTLTAKEASSPRTLLIVTTAHVNRGRPFVKVNGTPQRVPPAPSHLQVYGKGVYESRVFTRGAHLLSPATYTFGALQLKAGLNEIVIDVAGRLKPGLSPFLQPTFVYDYVALV